MIPKPATVLPDPDPDSLEHSRKVARHLHSAIEAAGDSVSFAEFMHECLYAPGLGYYRAGLKKFGAGGDFVTAPEISPVFGNVVARQCSELLTETGGDVLEIGAGSGALAIAMLSKLADLDCLPDRYLILEVSPELQQRQTDLVREKLPGMESRIEWVGDVPVGFTGVVVANEVADAIPVERFLIRDDEVLQARVTSDGSAFSWQFRPAPAFLERAVRDVEASLGNKLADGYCSEVSTGARAWLSGIAAGIERGAVLLIDYGMSRREYYAPDRGAGWLRCHFRHHAHDDPLILPGIQDITAWVDFTSLAEVATDRGMSILGYATQADFLIGGGLHRELGGYSDLTSEEQIELSGQVKLLTLPAEMGESFKCMALGLGEVTAPPAFRHYDRTHSL